MNTSNTLNYLEHCATALLGILFLAALVYLLTYAHYWARGTVTEIFNDRDLKAREAATDRTIEKLKGLRGGNVTLSTIDLPSGEYDPFSGSGLN